MNEQCAPLRDDPGGVDMPGPVTLDWWKHLGVRVTERAPGLTLDWA